MKVVVYGAGSVGCLIGGAWAAAGVDVGFIGRERIRAEIAANGLGVSDEEGWRVHFDADRIDYRTDANTLAGADVIALTVKSIGTEAAAVEISRYARADATLISFQNGVSNGPLLQRLLPKLEIVQGTVPYNVVRLAAGRWHKASVGDLAVERTAATQVLEAAIADRPGRLLLHDDMTGILWGKLLLNLNNAVNALSGVGLLEQLRQRDYRKVVAATMLETLDLLDAAGIAHEKVGRIGPRLLPQVMRTPDLLFGIFLKLQKIGTNARSSMADDLAAGRATEVDYLNGEVVKLAERLGRKAPVNASMVALVKQAEAGGARGWSAADLRAEVLGR